MARVPRYEIAIFDMIDLLYFNQLLVWTVFSDDDRARLDTIIAKLDRVVKAASLPLSSHGIAKHYVLALCESIFLINYCSVNKELILLHQDDGTPFEVEETLKRYSKDTANFIAYLAASNRPETITTDEWNAALNNITNSIFPDIELLPPHLKHRLAERCYVREYDSAALNFFISMTSLGVMTDAKVTSDVFSLDSDEFIRACLLLELECLRGAGIRSDSPTDDAIENIKKITKTGDRRERMLIAARIHAQIDSIVNDTANMTTVFSAQRCTDAVYLRKVLNISCPDLNRKRMFDSCTKAKWHGILASGPVEMEVADDQRNRRNRPIYNVKRADQSIANKVAHDFRTKGVILSDKCIYERHKQYTTETKEFIQTYYRKLCAQPDWSSFFMEDIYYNQLVIAHHNKLKELEGGG